MRTLPSTPVPAGGPAAARPCARSSAALLGLIFVLLPPCGFAAQEGAVERLQRFLAETRTLRAEFRQQLFDEDGGLVEEASGVVTLARPGRFRWVYEEPYEQQVVGDGERVWIYDADLDQVTVSDVDASLGTTPAMLLQSDRPLEDAFEVRALGTEGPLQWVELLPRGEESAFRVIRIAIAGEGLRAMDFDDDFGQSIRIAFEGLETNIHMDDDHFRFVVPAGADLYRR